MYPNTKHRSFVVREDVFTLKKNLLISINVMQLIFHILGYKIS